jgi:hypothetical protein
VQRDGAPKRVLGQVVDEPPTAVDLDHRQPFAMLALELRIAADVDLLELEAELLAQPPELLAGALAEVAPLRVVDDDPRQG